MLKPNCAIVLRNLGTKPRTHRSPVPEATIVHLRAEELKIGLIGLDTSHVIAFTQLINDPAGKEQVPGWKVVAAVKSFSSDIPSSAGTVEGYTAQLQKDFGAKIVGLIEELCAQVDCVMIESVDGRPDLEQARPVIAAKKRLFIDKPLAGNLKDAAEIVRLAKEAGVPIFTSSAYRYYSSMTELQAAQVGGIRSAISNGPAPTEPHHPDLFWYGIHAVEALFTVLGKGCKSVVRTTTPDTDVVTGIWSAGRVGVLHGIRTKPMPHKVTVFGSNGFAEQKSGGDSYAPLIAQVMRFFQTGDSPVSPDESLEILAFMEAADESKRRGGSPVKLGEVSRLE